jgi:ribokinase
MVVKLGPAGVWAGGRVYPAPPVQAVDSTGAGDAFAAGYLVGAVTQGLTGTGPVELGLRAAARAVATMGAMP